MLNRGRLLKVQQSASRRLPVPRPGEECGAALDVHTAAVTAVLV